MNKIILLITLVFSHLYCSAQEDSTKIIEIADFCCDLHSYEEAKTLADSLYTEYKKAPFSTVNKGEDKRDGIVFIRDLYVLATRLDPTQTGAKEMLEKIESDCPETNPCYKTVDSFNRAETCFARGDYACAVDLYTSVASSWCVDQEYVVAQLKQSKKLLKKSK